MLIYLRALEEQGKQVPQKFLPRPLIVPIKKTENRVTRVRFASQLRRERKKTSSKSMRQVTMAWKKSGSFVNELTMHRPKQRIRFILSMRFICFLPVPLMHY